MDNLCSTGMFWCAFDLVFGVGLGVLALVVVAGLAGIRKDSK